ncbi:MAG: hypothetical protein E4G94_01575 [ANME-2 cluster archaeon]|nr:MAG: hypothetical protein E4G94_01575 [ANME-2 cluster archaeon]
MSSLVDENTKMPLELTLSEIHQHISTVPYFSESPDINQETGKPLFSGNYTYDHKDNLRKELTYLRQSGYISKLGKSKPHTYRLTFLGVEHFRDPWAKYRIKKEQMEKTATLMAKAIMENSFEFEEAVREFVRTNQVPKINVIRQKAPIIRNPRVRAGRTEKITILNDDGSEQEVTIEELQSALLTVDKIRIKELEHSNTILMKQSEIAGYQQQIADLVYELEGKDITLSNIKRRNTGAMRVAQRKDLVYAVSGINPDELSGELAVEEPVGSEFFLTWGSIWGRKVIGAKFWNRKSFELMADTNPEVKVRDHAQELSYEQMDGVGMFISKIRRTGITVDAINDRMIKAVALVW